MKIAPLTLEVRVCLAVRTDVAPVGEVTYQACQQLAAVPQVAAHPAQSARQGIEVPVTGDHFLEDTVQGA